MFEQDMEEARTNCIQIPDADTATMNDFLRFIYSGQIQTKDRCMYEICSALLPLAKKYEVKSLIDLCSSQLLQHITEVNAADVLCLADMLGVFPLKKFALRFITQSNDTLLAVQDTDGFDKLDKSLVREILFATASHCAGSAKHAREEELEFPDGSHWERLGASQLRRACSERSLANDGN